MNSNADQANAVTGASYRVACLSGGGIGPEVMAEATRVLQEVARLHAFEVEELHVPFGAEAQTSLGHPLPAKTRAAYRGADAILAASRRTPELDGVRSELELVAELRRAGFAPDGDVAMLNPIASGHEEWTIARAFLLAGYRRGRLSSVGADRDWRLLVERLGADRPEIEIEHLSVETARLIVATDPSHLDVVVAGEETAGDLARGAEEMTLVAAEADLAASGPSLFGPTHRTASRIAGLGVANPSGVLVAVSLLLAEGLGERVAAGTLDRAIRKALRKGARTADMVKAGIAATTREFTETVLAELPRARQDNDLSTEELR
jgi:3-isopropylmalate dehydrogenase